MLAELIDTPLWLAFLFASLVLALTPGPGVLFIVSRTLAQGRKAGLLTVAGVALGNFGNALGAGLGLATLFSVSSTAFSLVKFAGVCYLFYLGYSTLRAPVPTLGLAPMQPKSESRLTREGFWVALLNPKTTIFFAAFLPQFMNSEASPFTQSLLFGTSFVIIAATTDSIYVLAAGGLRQAFSQFASSTSVSRYGKALVYFGLGAFTAITGQRSLVSPRP